MEEKAEDIIEVEDTRPEYMKKRVIVPSVTAIIFLICGIFTLFTLFITNQQTMLL